jgi:serine/threonine protein kinase
MAAVAGERAGTALLIGIGEYLHSGQVWPLRFAAHDAEAMADALTDPEVCRFHAGKVKLLTDASAARDAVVHHLSKWLPEQAKGAEIAVIYFACHGTVQAVGRREEGYLLPYDADPEDLVTRGVSMADLASWIEAIDAGAVVVCLDCCHAAKVIARGGNAAAEAIARDMRIRPAILQPLAGRGRYLIASCDEGQVSVEAETWGHGLFTYHLLEGLRGAGDRDGDGRVGIAELFEHVAEAVERDALTVGMAQRPWSSAIGPGGVFLAAPVQAPRLGTGLLPRIEMGDRGVDDTAELSGGRGRDSGSVAALTARLAELRRTRDPAGVPEVLGSLAHASAAVREEAKKAARALGWEQTAAAILDLARGGAATAMRSVLEGLVALESHRDVVTLLDRLVILLTGDLRNQAVSMLDRKRLVLQMEKTAEVFRSIQSPFRLTRVLGQGSIASAYAARDEEDGLTVVVRVLRPEIVGQPQLRAQFLDLSRQSRRIVHQNLVLTREVRAFPEHDLYFVVRDHVDGVTLQSLIYAGREFSSRRILSILREVAAALGELHRAGMVHGGVKPSNIFLLNDDRTVLGDPTLPVPALGASMERLSYDYRYAAPEMFQGSCSAGRAADLYALGCVAHELACGRPPFVADNPFELSSLHVNRTPEPPSLYRSRLGHLGDAMLLKLLAKLPSDRYATVHDLVRDLEALDHELTTISAPGADDVRPPEETEGVVSVEDESGFESLEEPSSGADSQPQAADELARVASPSPRQEEAVSIVSFDPNTMAPSLDATPPAAWKTTKPPQRLGKYEILKELGEGGMGTVYLARDPHLNRELALKVMRGMAGVEGSRGARFLREARAVARLRHPGIIQIFGLDEQDGVVFLALEYVGGGSLRARIRSEGPMPPDQAARLVLQLAQAVHAAHGQDIIHRDLKPSNILLDENGTPKISDFGLVKLGDQLLEEEENPTNPGQPIGTPGYMAPEQVGGETIGPATDVYGLGTILYECLIGHGPFPGRGSMEVLYRIMEQPPASLRQIRPEIPPVLERICLKCLEKDPRKRYAGADELARALEEFLSGREREEPPDAGDAGPAAVEHTPPTATEPPRPAVRQGLWVRMTRWFAGK